MARRWRMALGLDAPVPPHEAGSPEASLHPDAGGHSDAGPLSWGGTRACPTRAHPTRASPDAGPPVQECLAIPSGQWQEITPPALHREWWCTPDFNPAGCGSPGDTGPELISYLRRALFRSRAERARNDLPGDIVARPVALDRLRRTLGARGRRRQPRRRWSQLDDRGRPQRRADPLHDRGLRNGRRLQEHHRGRELDADTPAQHRGRGQLRREDRDGSGEPGPSHGQLP